jgi:hypothetical protein
VLCASFGIQAQRRLTPYPVNPPSHRKTLHHGNRRT